MFLVVFLLIFWGSLYFLVVTFLLDFDIANIFSQFAIHLLTLTMIAITQKVFNFHIISLVFLPMDFDFGVFFFFLKKSYSSPKLTKIISYLNFYYFIISLFSFRSLILLDFIFYVMCEVGNINYFFLTLFYA